MVLDVEYRWQRCGVRRRLATEKSVVSRDGAIRAWCEGTASWIPLITDLVAPAPSG